MKYNKKMNVKPEAQYGFHTVGEILNDFLASNEPFAVANRQRLHPNTELCIDLKTLLCDDPKMVPGKDYVGVLNNDREDHYVFMQTRLDWVARRNPKIFSGKYITITKRRDGSLHLNFRTLSMDKGFSIERYAKGVARELCQALKCLIEE